MTRPNVWLAQDLALPIQCACASLVALGAAYASYRHGRESALRFGADTVTASIWPLPVDGLLTIATVGLWKPHGNGRRSGRWVAWLAFVFGICLSLVQSRRRTWRILSRQPSSGCGSTTSASAWPHADGRRAGSRGWHAQLRSANSPKVEDRARSAGRWSRTFCGDWCDNDAREGGQALGSVVVMVMCPRAASGGGGGSAKISPERLPTAVALM